VLTPSSVELRLSFGCRFLRLATPSAHAHVGARDVVVTFFDGADRFSLVAGGGVRREEGGRAG
jgi:hypothetical protein